MTANLPLVFPKAVGPFVRTGGAARVERSGPSRFWTAEKLHHSASRLHASILFFAIAQISGALGLAFFGALMGDGSSRSGLVLGYVVRGLIMVVGGVIELIGIKAEGQSLETGHHAADSGVY